MSLVDEVGPLENLPRLRVSRVSGSELHQPVADIREQLTRDAGVAQLDDVQKPVNV